MARFSFCLPRAFGNDDNYISPSPVDKTEPAQQGQESAKRSERLGERAFRFLSPGESFASCFSIVRSVAVSESKH